MTIPALLELATTRLPSDGREDTPSRFPLADRVRPVRTPVWRLEMATRDVTREIAPFVMSVRYTDHAHGKSDDVELVVQNGDGRWRTKWYPTKGDKLSLAIGYEGQPLLPCGQFEIDEVEDSGPPDLFTLRALATGITGTLRTRRTVAYDGQTLRQIADAIARRQALELVGEIADLKIGRATQHQESDLTFLKRVADGFGYVFSVRGSQLVFYELAALELKGAVFTIRRGDCGRHSLTDKTHQLYREAVVRYHDSDRGTLIEQKVPAASIVVGDILHLTPRVENAQQARARAMAALRKANTLQAKGMLELEGEARLVAGNNVKLVDFGANDGLYQIEQSSHALDRDRGYRTEVEVKRVG